GKTYGSSSANSSLADFQPFTSGGTVSPYSPPHSIAMACGTAPGQYAKVTSGDLVFPGQITARNGGAITSPYGRGFANWSRPILIEFAVDPELGSDVVNGA